MQTWNIDKRQMETGKGIVAAQHFEAAEAGAKVLADGGNAMDAAVVTALVLSVVEPWLSGVGGGGLLLWADADGTTVDTLDFNVRASRNVSREQYPLKGGRDGDWFDWPAVEGDRNITGYTSIGVPGAIAGFAAALEKYGTLSWAEALEPAIALAERGMIVDWFTSLCLTIDLAGLSQFPDTAALFLDEGKPRKVAQTGEETYLPMPAKAKMLRKLAQRGARDFYEGEIARGLVEDLQAGGSVIDLEDLAVYAPRWATSQSSAYRDCDVHVVPGLCGGPSLLQTMDTLRESLPDGAVTGAGAASAYARAIRGTYQDRLKTMGHASKKGEDCTSHVSVVDAAGNMVSLTNTLLSRFGSKVLLPQSGILMNNGMMWFDPREGVPNSIAPGAQPLANMSPVILLRDGRPWLAIGAAGGRQIFPALTQLISYVVDGGMSLHEAFHTPRLDGSGPTIVVDRDAPADVAASVAEHFPVRITSNTLHPVCFAIPSAVLSDRTSGRRYGMVHPVNPWTAAVAEDTGDA
ncbi:gamma-glutamyltransferase [Hoeflea ulvae]|uniref:Gamma-glutamyltransferase n=1 Tax=Hoeflea ulvae TaxID=2983764 RepID=A0ABT3YKB9_9HYPH|nr:gamma-glutamyltransferase [Hoeflea ulvae]MCY0096356.1 gamma-glutamyltransferase [Hoeflea ulvae]